MTDPPKKPRKGPASDLEYLRSIGLGGLAKSLSQLESIYKTMDFGGLSKAQLDSIQRSVELGGVAKSQLESIQRSMDISGVAKAASLAESIQRSWSLAGLSKTSSLVESIQKSMDFSTFAKTASVIEPIQKSHGVGSTKPSVFESMLRGAQFEQMNRRLADLRLPFESLILNPLPLPRFELPKELGRLTEDLNRWVERMRRPLTPEERRLVEFRMARGWYLSPDEPFGDQELMDLMDQGDRDGVEAAIAEVARTRVGVIAERVGTWSPARRPLIEAAVAAHERGDYALSVPALLAQADGFGKDILGVPFYSWERNPAAGPRTRGSVKKKIGKDSDWQPSRLDAYLVFLHDGSSVMTTTQNRDARRKEDPGYGPLNRHGVLHGLDLDYATELNSLRVVMLLDYIAWIADDFVAPVVAEGAGDVSAPSSNADGSSEADP